MGGPGPRTNAGALRKPGLRSTRSHRVGQFRFNPMQACAVQLARSLVPYGMMQNDALKPPLPLCLEAYNLTFTFRCLHPISLSSPLTSLASGES
eukprot:6199935-Pleurochrysis_carterae.AAC.2